MSIYRENKIVSYYKNSPLPAKAAIWFVIANVIQKGISLLTTPIFTRLLTTDQYGMFSVYQSWYSILTIVLTLSLHNGVFNNELVQEPERKDDLTAAFLGLSNTVTVLFFLAYLVARNFWNNFFDLSTFFVLVIFVEALFIPAYNLWMAGEKFYYKYQTVVAVSIFIALSSPVIGVIGIVLTQYKAETRVLTFAAIQLIVGLLSYLRIVSRSRKIVSKEYWLRGIKFNMPLIPHWLSLTVLGSADRIIIKKLIGSSQAAIYGVAYTISMMFSLAVDGINQVLTPYTYKKLRTGQYSNIRINGMFLSALVFGGCLGAMVLGPEIIRVFAAPEYYEARWIVPSVACSVFFSFQYNLFSIVEFYFAKTKSIMLESCFAAILNITLNYIAIPIYGYMAAAYTTLACYIFLSISHAVIACVTLETNNIQIGEVYNLKFVITLSILMLFAMLFMLTLYDITGVRYMILLAILILLLRYQHQIIGKFKELKSK